MDVQVKAVRTGYYNHKRQREGRVFEMNKADIKVDAKGNLISPKWVELMNKTKATSAKSQIAADKSASDETVI